MTRSRLILRERGPVGCLLVHGFTGTPDELLELAEFLADQGITVALPTLPGHGTYSADLFKFTWRDWFACVKTAHDELEQRCDEVFVAGLSMGGALALHLAAHRPVPGVIALAAAVRLPSWKKMAVGLLKDVWKYRRKRNGEDVRNVSAKEKLRSYDRFPLKAAHELFRLLEHVRDDLPEITAPILIMHAKEDHTVPFENAQEIYDRVSSTDKRKVDLEQSYHVITVDYDKEQVKQDVSGFIQSHSQALDAQPSQRKKAKKSAAKASKPGVRERS